MVGICWGYFRLGIFNFRALAIDLGNWALSLALNLAVVGNPIGKISNSIAKIGHSIGKIGNQIGDIHDNLFVIWKYIQYHKIHNILYNILLTLMLNNSDVFAYFSNMFDKWWRIINMSLSYVCHSFDFFILWTYCVNIWLKYY